MAILNPEKQRQFAIEAVERLRAGGFEAYWAGGCVRDHLLSRPPKDYDVATSARPEQIQDLFGRKRTLAIGAAFGVIKVVGPRGAGEIEVATFRQDAAYSDGRHPDAVTFSSPEQDAARRDFTINGLFYDPLSHEVIDFVDGERDLQAGVVRAIGDPRLRLTEDKLRLLRAVRFAATFEFEIEPATLGAVQEMATQITVVSPERIASEMRAMLVLAGRARAVELLHTVGLLAVLLPEIAAKTELTNRWPLTLAELGSLAEPSFSLALAALVHRFVDAAQVEEICRRWRLSNRERLRICWLVEQAGQFLAAREMPWPRLQRLLIDPGSADLLALDAAIARAEGSDTGGLEYCRSQLARPERELNPPPLLTGDDLILHGVPRGRQYQELLEKIRDAQLENKIRNKREALELVDRLRAAYNE